MAAKNDGHISFVRQEVADDSAAIPNTTKLEVTVGHDADSAYDEEEILAVKESDFKRKQVRKISIADICCI